MGSQPLGIPLTLPMALWVVPSFQCLHLNFEFIFISSWALSDTPYQYKILFPFFFSAAIVCLVIGCIIENKPL